MRYNVRILPRAQSDVAGILHWLIRDRQSPLGAGEWLRAFDEATTKLAHNPESYCIAPESASLNRELRQFLFKTRRGRTYRGVHIIFGDEVLVLRVRGPGQPPLTDDELA